MKMGIRFVAQYYDIKSGKALESKTIHSTEIKKPITLKEFGFLHAEQIKLLESIQEFKLLYETKLINADSACPKCGDKTLCRGTRKSNFHAALTDHKIGSSSKAGRTIMSQISYHIDSNRTYLSFSRYAAHFFANRSRLR